MTSQLCHTERFIHVSSSIDPLYTFADLPPHGCPHEASGHLATHTGRHNQGKH
jgi:hypothetical protein